MLIVAEKFEYGTTGDRSQNSQPHKLSKSTWTTVRNASPIQSISWEWKGNG
ncbi:hypothetical protein JOY44_26035 (plasmid) [Phormidium sp. CLA17]|uniref:hypothetical protein n=1 Tax=Leptolyngbya sp. Cla-17 TaxID=2803751 RepID=UPI0014909677|nr:hypothetical protein [Leptolyngbya sp. Cla-17]MBM0744982.1 hypothetical protein [Leptolyngbya sp. Cla-17]